MTPTWDHERRVTRLRLSKARRYLDRFHAQMRAAGVRDPESDKAALQKALEVVRGAGPEQWALMARHMTEDNLKAGIHKTEEAPSPATVECIVAELETAIRRCDARPNEDDVELITGAIRERGTGTTRPEDMPAEGEG
jgi:hypothetical protein